MATAAAALRLLLLVAAAATVTILGSVTSHLPLHYTHRSSLLMNDLVALVLGYMTTPCDADSNSGL